MNKPRAAAYTVPVVTRKRCAIYTRKSTEEGLDQDYNSLEAQRDAGLAFVASQRSEGWIPVPEGYDDGGFSGGNLDRPALKRLLTDVEEQKVDIVVVYKIDRLTRSLTDFSKLVEVFDRNGVSFVSVTQQFNTTTSMGRLTLNILLSFAQFEREVTGERIRDKIAASKAKGMWMGGVPPLGYDVVDRKLVVNPAEANLVRDIFRRYGEHGSAARLVRELEMEGRTTKVWRAGSGQLHEGRPIDQQFLAKLLRNRIYLGEIRHKGQSYAGQHEPIVSTGLWDGAHAFLNRRKMGPRERLTEFPALLAGLLYAPDGQLMIQTYTRKKNGRMYRYYVPYLERRRSAGATLVPGIPATGPLPAADVEAAVLERVHEMLQAPQMQIAVWRACLKHPSGLTIDEPTAVVALRRIGAVWKQLFPAEQQRIVALLIERVQLHAVGVDIKWREDGWLGLDADIAQQPLVLENATPEEEALA